MGKYTLNIFERYKLISLAKKQRLGKSERSDLKKWEYLLAKATFTPSGYYLSEKIKTDFLNYLKQHHPYVKDIERFFMSDDAIEYSIVNDSKLRKILVKYQGRTFN